MCTAKRRPLTRDGRDVSAAVASLSLCDPYSPTDDSSDDPSISHHGMLPPIEDTFWPAVRAQLRSGADFSRLRVNCVVCFEQLRFSGLGRHVIPAGGSSEEVAFVLPCGHLIGHGCLRVILDGAWDRAALEAPAGEDYKPPECPMCKHELQYRGCLHVVDGQPAPRSMRTLAEFPATVPEGARVGADCFRCLLADFITRLEHLGRACGRAVRLHAQMDASKRREAYADRGVADPTEAVDLKDLQDLAEHAAGTFARAMTQLWNGTNLIKHYESSKKRFLPRFECVPQAVSSETSG